MARINRPLGPDDRGGTGGIRRERGLPTEAAGAVTVTVTFVAELPGVTGLGGTVQVAPGGAPVQVKATLWLNPPSPPIFKTNFAVCPGATVCDVGEPGDAASVKSWPLPLSATVCGLPDASSVTDNVPGIAPPVVGSKYTVIVQLPPTVTAVPQLLVSE